MKKLAVSSKKVIFEDVSGSAQYQRAKRKGKGRSQMLLMVDYAINLLGKVK